MYWNMFIIDFESVFIVEEPKKKKKIRENLKEKC